MCVRFAPAACAARLTRAPRPADNGWLSGVKLVLDGIGPGNSQVHYEYSNDLTAVLLSSPPQGQFLTPTRSGATVPIVTGVPFSYYSMCVALALHAVVLVLVC